MTKSDSTPIDYIVFLGMTDNKEVFPARVTCKASKLRPRKGEFAAFVVKATSQREALWKASQHYYSKMAIALSELWVNEDVADSQKWEWDNPFHSNILEGLQQAKDEFAEHLDLPADKIVLPVTLK